MQIACKRFSCQKAVEVCYWACKYRKDCKDWHGALETVPGADAMRAQLESAAQKSGRVFDAETLVFRAGKKGKRNKQAAVVSLSPRAHLKSDGTSARAATHLQDPRASGSSKQFPNPTHGEEQTTMEDLVAEESLEVQATEAPAADAAKPAAKEKADKGKDKPKPAKPKPVTNTGPIYLLLFANGKYKELRESELQTEAAGVLKDPTLRLVKGQFLIPQVSFKTADE